MSPFFENVFARLKATSMGSPNADKAITSAENSHQVFTPSLPLSGHFHDITLSFFSHFLGNFFTFQALFVQPLSLDAL